MDMDPEEMVVAIIAASENPVPHHLLVNTMRLSWQEIVVQSCSNSFGT